MAEVDIKVVRAYDSIYGNGKHVFSIVVDDSSAQYIFPVDSELFDGKSRIKRLTSDESAKKPSSPSEWVKLAIRGLGSYDYSTVTYPDDIDTVKKAVTEEKNIINSEENNSISLGRTRATAEEQNISRITSSMMLENEEFAQFVEGSVEELSDETAKQHITDLIIAADTLDENPWLEPWLNGEDTETLDFSKGLVLRKSVKKFEDFQSNFDDDLFEEEDEKEEETN